MCNCQRNDEVFPPSGIPEHNFPSRFENFHWWGETEVPTEVCYKSIKRDELPIPPLHEERWRYPYRYSSCAPSTSALKWKQSQKQPDNALQSRKKIQMEPRDIRQVKGYETTSMDSSLEPFLYHAPTIIIRKEIPASLLTPTWAPRCAHTDFDEFILRSLHPKYKKDPKIRKRIQFCSRDSNREICVALNEMQNLDSKPAKKIKKKEFLFTSQRPGHRPATENLPPRVCPNPINDEVYIRPKTCHQEYAQTQSMMKFTSAHRPATKSMPKPNQ
ncbi:hypothetical protein RRG08_044911 [Elysia crispata]|uniref:Uncharacterized protein n=1 Tax=Elysia crispata TaxID=231223 RepID=A0AAE0ZED4_9GAST|nr:hypothetical protein RRG08_044911 [Elysia crispata]